MISISFFFFFFFEVWTYLQQLILLILNRIQFHFLQSYFDLLLLKELIECHFIKNVSI